MSEFTRALRTVFLFLVNLTINLVCAAFGLASLLWLPRLPWSLPEVALPGAPRDKWRERCIVNFLIIFVDVPGIVLFVAALAVPWRTIPSLRELGKDMDKKKVGINGDVRITAYMSFFASLGDILTIPAAICAALNILGWSKTRQMVAKVKEDDFYTSEYREIAWCQGADFFLSLVVLPCLLLGLLSWRTVRFQRLVLGNHADGSGPLPTRGAAALQQKARVVGEFLQTLIDLPLIVLGAVVLFTVWRAAPLVRELGEAEDPDDARLAAWRQFLLLLRDIPFIGLSLVLVVTFYRLPAFIFGLKARLSVPKDSYSYTPRHRVTRLRLKFLEGGGFHLILHAHADSEEAEDDPSSGKGACLFVGADALWSAIGQHFGDAAATIGRGMMPLPLVGDSFAAERDGSELCFRFDTGNMLKVKRKSVLKALVKLQASSPRIILQGDHDGGVLFHTCVDLPALHAAIDTDSDLTIESAHQRLQESATDDELDFGGAFSYVVGEQFLLLMRDLFTAIGFVLVCVALPWRALRMIGGVVQHPDRAKAVKVSHILDRVRRVLASNLPRRRRWAAIDSLTTSFKGPGLFVDSAQTGASSADRKRLEQYDKLLDKLTEGALEPVSSIATELVDHAKEFWNKLGAARWALAQQDHAASRTNLADVSRLEGELDSREALLQAAVVDVPPLAADWSLKHRGIGDIAMIVGKEILEGLIDIGAVLALVFVLCTLYRIPSYYVLIVRQRRSFRHAGTRTLLEILIDAVFLVKMLVVIVAVHHLPSAVGAIMSSIYVDRSVAAVRDVIDHYFDDAAEDIGRLLSLCTAWRTYKYVLAIAVWGLLSPLVYVGESLETLGAGKLVRRVGATLLWGMWFSFPFAVVYGVAQSGIDAALACFLVSLYAAVALAIASYDTSSSSSQPATGRGTAAAGVIALSLEAYQLVAYALMADAGDNEAPDSTLLARIGLPAHFAIGGFDDGDIWLATFWTVFALFALWFVLASLPTVVEDLLEWQPRGFFARDPAWRAATRLLNSGLFLPIITSMLRVLSCRGSPLHLRDYPAVECFQGTHETVALLALLALSFYVPTGAFSLANSDRQVRTAFTPRFELMVLLAKLVLSTIRIFATDRTAAVSLYLVVFLCLEGFAIAAYQSATAANHGQMVLRLCAFASAAWACVVVLAQGDIGMAAAGWAVIAVVGIIAEARWRGAQARLLGVPVAEAQALVTRLREAEAAFRKMLIRQWDTRVWARRLRVVGRRRRLDAMRECVEDLEAGIQIAAQSESWRDTDRAAWCMRVTKATEATALKDQVDELVAEQERCMGQQASAAADQEVRVRDVEVALGDES